MSVRDVTEADSGRAPVVSVVLPCYNAHEFLGRALESIRAQTFHEYEIVVVDDGSTDPATLAVLKALPADIRVIRQKNRGLAGARNTGFREARGRLVVPLDCDDWLDPAFLEKAMNAMGGCDETMTFVFSHLALEGDASGTLSKGFNMFEQLFANQLPYCMLIGKNLWNLAGGYDESMRHGCEDWEFNIRLSALGARAVVVPEPLFHYRVSASGMLQTITHKRRGAVWTQIQGKHKDLYCMSALWSLWRKWRHMPSTRPTWLYFLYWGCHRILPAPVFLWVFRTAMRFSQSRRLRVRAG